MAKGFKHGAGGGAPLNFKVVGNPQPASPKENTIWVNTDVEITGWIFSATEPENPSEGMVWITTGKTSLIEFNALKKNSIQVYPMSAKQYVGGAWVEREAKSYQNGAWVDWWNGELFQDGNQYTSVTGGWVVFDSSLASYATPTLTFDSGKMVISMRQPSYEYRGGVVCAKNTIDLTDVNEITLKLKSFSALGTYAEPSYYGAVSLVVFDDKGTTVLPNGLANSTKKISNTTEYDFALSVDTKSISGSHSVGIKLFSFTAAAATLTATVESVIMS